MNAFLALDEILRETGGIPLTKDLVRKLLSRLVEQTIIPIFCVLAFF